MSNSATFSYAQAAKGQSAVQSVQSSLAQSQAPSTTSTQSRDTAPTPSTRAPSVAVSTTSNELDGSQHTRSSSVKPDSLSLNSSDAGSVSASDKAVESSILPNQSAEKVLGGGLPQGAERRGRGQTLTSQATDAGDSKKGRKGRKGRTTEKESDQGQDQDKKESVPLKVELSEAPVPTVNIWTQRQEARAAKVKPTSSVATQPRGTNNTNAAQTDGVSNASSQDHKQRALQNDGADGAATHGKSSSGGVKPPKKDAEQSRTAGNQMSRRPAPRGARAPNGEDRQAFEAQGPIVNNTSSWPTPETAANGVKVQVNNEKPEKEEKDESGPSKPQEKKKWVTVPFVPTVTFETPMPARGSRGGRANGTRGGRDGAVRGNHPRGASTERNQDNTTMAGATSIAPPASKRASVDMHTSRDNRKPQAQAGTGRVSGEVLPASSKAEASKQTPADSDRGITSQHNLARATGPSVRADETTKLPQPARENGMHSMKDSNFQGQTNGNRNDRTRGSTRGRGGHPTVNGVGHPQSQFTQSSAGYNYQANAAFRQPNSPYVPGYTAMPFGGPFPVQTAGGHHRNRPSSGTNRSQGSARHQSSRPSYPVLSSPYDAGMFPPNSPYAAYGADPNHILSVVLSQVEYYFSIDNLCKDTYLRKFMDSQGFVPLGVIASFKRMQEIAQDYQLIRIACDNSPHIEFVVTDEGLDKVRRREQWQPWVLNMHLRHPSAQNDGPVSYRPFSSQMSYWPQLIPFAGEANPLFSPTGTDSHFSHHLNGNSATSPTSNGMNGHSRPSESQLSAAVPEFSPIGNPIMGGTNQTVFSDANANGQMLDNANGQMLDNASKKGSAVSYLGEQVGFLPNGSHKTGGMEQISHYDELTTNGINGNTHGTESY
ncbi:hypothetical protein F4677DRAFT_446183 [Hypoxylon crocopeplum]|nr:hypothetical protein F4677DRAFT_446183 [Hypoxylon crocopeplum]